MANNIIAIGGGILLFVTKATHSVYVLIIGRFLVGINAGMLLTYINSFNRSFIHLFIYSFIHTFIHSFINLFTYSFVY